MPRTLKTKAPKTHTLSPALLEARLLNVSVVGVGGTGSEVLSGLIHLHHALQAHGRPGLMVHAYDPDTVSQANLVRQRYHPADLGKNKAEVLIRRINAATGTNWRAHPRAFDHTSYSLQRNIDVLLSCVDTRAARATIHGIICSCLSNSCKLWMDFGNEDRYGQVIVGEPFAPRRISDITLPCAPQLHPELIDTSEPEEDRPSCSAIEALSKQDLLVNKMVSTYGLHLLWEALKTGKLAFHGYYFNLNTGRANALPVPTRPRQTRKQPAAGEGNTSTRQPPTP